MSTATPITSPSVKDGMRVRNGVSPNHQPSFLMINGRAHLLNDRDSELQMFGNTDSVPVKPLIVEVGAAIGVAYLAKAADDPKVYLVYDGYKRWIPSPQVFEEFGFQWDAIRTLTAAEIAAIPSGPDVG